jgi:hypothetical protein
MNSKKDTSITPSDGSVFYNILNQIKLIAHLMADRRISPWLKLLPIGSLVYLVFPDIIPGPIDDAAAIWLATYLFVELCPPEIVKEHQEKIKKIGGVTKEDLLNKEDIVDAEFWEK